MTPLLIGLLIGWRPVAGAGEPLTLNDCWRTALTHSNTYQAASRELKAAEAGVRIADANQGVQVGLRGSYQHEYDEDRNLTFTYDVPDYQTERSDYDQAAGKIAVSRSLLTGGTVELGGGVRTTDFSSTFNPATSSTRIVYSVDLRQPLFKANAYRLDEARAELGLQFAEANLALVKADLFLTVTDGYYDAVTAAREIELRREELAALQQVGVIMAARLTAREATEWERERAALAVAEAEVEVREAVANEAVARLELAGLLGIDNLEAVALTDAETALPGTAGALPRPPAQYPRHPRAIMAQSRYEMAEMSYLETSERYGKQMELTGNYAWEGDNNSGGTLADLEKTWAVGMTLRVPLYDGGIREDQVGIAAADSATAGERIAVENRRICREVQIATNRIELLRELLTVAQAKVAQARERVRLEELKYRIGEGELATLLEARQGLLAVHHDLFRHETELAKSRLEYVAALGLDPAECYEEARKASSPTLDQRRIDDRER